MSYEIDHEVIPAHHQLSLLIDLAEQHGIDHHQLLNGSRIFLEDILLGNKLISQLQLYKIAHNASLTGQHLQFLFGGECFTTPLNHAISSLLYAKNFEEVLSRLTELHILICPWLTPKVMRTNDQITIYWLNSKPIEQLYFVEMTMSAITALSKHLFQEKLPWKYEFSTTEPQYIEQYLGYFGSQLSFNCPIHCMKLSSEYLQQPLKQYSATMSSVHYAQAQHYIQNHNLQKSFLEHINLYLTEHIQENISLESMAHAFSVSPATLKRRLKKHLTHFQAQRDQSRLHTALKLRYVDHFNTEQIANYLAIHDRNNFRRAFKRWTYYSLI